MCRVVFGLEAKCRYNRGVHKFYDNPLVHPEPGEARVAPNLTIGGVHIAPATVLAPMAGITDTVFRRFIREMGGCGLLMTEFTSADGVTRKKDKKAQRFLNFYEDEHPISSQLFGSNPESLAEAARIVEGFGFDLVDLNLGCPAKKVVKCNGGSGLLRELPVIRKIFESVRAAVKIPFTVKFRAGWSESELVFRELAKMAEGCGLDAVAMHARTREQGYSGQAQWQWIARVEIPGFDSGDWQWRHTHSGGRARDGGRDRLRRGDDRTSRGFESLDFQANFAIHRDRQL